MAQEWYLMNTSYDVVSGFENDDFNYDSAEVMSEILETDIAQNVEICNYDLSECKPIKVIVDGRTPDTKLRTLSRQIIAPIGTFRAGMYIKYKDKYWLIISLVDNNGVYEKAIVSLCNYHLTWINKDKKIVQRWANIVSASQYNNGETGMKYYFVRSDQLLVSLPDDRDSILLETDERFVIDGRCDIYEKEFIGKEDRNTALPLSVYKLTRSDTVLYNYKGSGHAEFMATQDEQRENDGYYVIDGKGYWLCEQPKKEEVSPVTERGTLEIVCEEPNIYVGMGETVFLAKVNPRSDELSLPVWSIESEFNDQLNVLETQNSISISTDIEGLIGKSFTLKLSLEGFPLVVQIVQIKSFL